MPTETVPDLVEAFRRFHVLEPAQYEEIQRSLLPRLPDSKSLARELIRRDWLTPFQANQLLVGKGQELLLGSYVLLERLGEGGMGAVFKARNWKLGQIVALKLIKNLNHPQLVQRFQREIRVAAQLNHPNIIRSYDADCAGEVHFLVMECCPGVDLGRVVRKDGPLSIAKACECMLQAALGLQHACERGLVHRDIKPANLLLTSDGTIKILDMGLARLEMDESPTDPEASGALTRQGVVMGTVDYMAPEQAMNFHAADIRADLYSLGCSFYFLLAGRVPFPGGEALARLMRHRQEEATPIETLRPDVPQGVAEVVRTLMAKKPEHRFQTPAELASALQTAPTEAIPGLVSSQVTCTQELAIDTDPAGGPTDAGELPAPTKKKKPRRVWLLAGAGGASLLLLILLLIQPWGRSSSRSNLGAAGLDASETRSVWADRFKQVPMLPGAMEEVVEGLKGTKPPGLLTVLGLGLPQHWGSIQRVVYSPDGRVVLTGGSEGEVKVWEAGTGRVLRRIQAHQDEIVLIAFSADSKILVTASKDSEVLLWDASSWEKQKSFSILPRIMTQVALSRDGKLLAVGQQDGKIRFWDLPGLDAKPTARAVPLALHTGAITGLAFSPDDRLLASAGPDKDVVIWDLKASKEKSRLPRPAGPVTFLMFHPRGQMLAAGYAGYDGLVNLWDLETGEEADDYKAWSVAYHGAFSRNGNWLATTGNLNETRVWNLTTGKLLRSSPGGALAFSPDSKSLATGPAHTLELRDVPATTPRPRYPEYPQPIQCIASHPVSQTVAWGLRDGTIQVLGPSEQPLRSLKGLHENVDQLLFSPDGRLVASRSGEKRLLRAWIVATGQLHSEIPYPDVRGFAFTSDSAALLVWTQTNLRRWDLARKQEITMIVSPDLRVAKSMALSPDGRLLALGVAGGTIQLWDLKAGRETDLLTEPDKEAMFLAFRPDGKGLLSNHLSSNVVKRWDRATVKKQSNLNGTDGAFSCAAFSPGGKVLATGYGDGAVRLWDPDSGTALETLQLCSKAGTIVQLAFLDERYLATVNSNGTLYVLQLPARGKA